MAREAGGGDDAHLGAIEPVALLGVQIVPADDPTGRAATIVERTGARLVADQATAEAIFAELAAAGALPEASGTDPDVLRAELESARGEAGRHPVPQEAVASLRRLAVELTRMSSIRDRTELAMADTLAQRWGGSTGLAVHPASIQAAAEDLLDAEAELAAAEEQMSSRKAAPEPSPRRAAPSYDDFYDDDALERRRALAMHGVIGAVVAGIGIVAGFLTGLLAVGLFGVAAGLAVVALAGVRRTGEEPVARVPTPAREPLPQEQALASAELLLAQARVRSAQRHWEGLAGPDADPRDLQSVLRRHDPQHQLIGLATETSPTIRTVRTVQRRLQARWRIAWAKLGVDDPPSPADLERHLAEAGGDAAAWNERVARVRALEATLAASEALQRQVVLVDPLAWCDPARLSELLNARPVGSHVMIVTRPEPDPDGSLSL